MNEDLNAYYNKYNEDKRLTTPYGRVEFLTTMRYIERFIAGRNGLEILEKGLTASPPEFDSLMYALVRGA